VTGIHYGWRICVGWTDYIEGVTRCQTVTSPVGVLNWQWCVGAALTHNVWTMGQDVDGILLQEPFTAYGFGPGDLEINRLSLGELQREVDCRLRSGNKKHVQVEGSSDVLSRYSAKTLASGGTFRVWCVTLIQNTVNAKPVTPLLLPDLFPMTTLLKSIRKWPRALWGVLVSDCNRSLDTLLTNMLHGPRPEIRDQRH
jgi:hypothetical protein